jgi:hypothetical protein
MGQFVWADKNHTTCGVGIGDSFVRLVPTASQQRAAAAGCAGGIALPLDLSRDNGGRLCGQENSRNVGLGNGAE